MHVKNYFGIVDYCVFAGLLIITAFIGSFYSYIGNKSPEEFLMGNRALKALPVAMSLLSTYVSASNLLGYTGEVYGNGMQVSAIELASPFAVIFASYLVLPVLYPLKLTSINEYIELRFQSKRLRFAIFLATFTKALLVGGITLYAPTLALQSMTKLDTLSSILLLGIICALYSSFGGIRAVIWTDVFQFIVMMTGLVIIVGIGIALNGGLIETLHIASKGGRTEIFDMRMSPFLQYTFFSSFGYGFLTHLRSHISLQAGAQRIWAVKSIEKAKRVLKYDIFGKLLIILLIFPGGLMVYAAYVGCDPMALGLIKKKDQIFSYFVMDKLSFIPGLPGLFVAALVGGSLSTLSSVINSGVALVWRDVFLKFNYFQTASPIFATLMNKIISMAVGVIIIGLAILTSKAKGLIHVGITVTSVFGSPCLGVFLIGYFLPKCNIKGVWTGFSVSSLFMLWMALGSMFYRTPSTMLPFSADECDYSNFTISKSRPETFILSTNNTKEEISENTSFIVSLYKVSQTLYGIVGPFICIFLAIISSCLTGNQKLEEVSPTLISPCVRQFYWKREELSNLHKNGSKPQNFRVNSEEINAEDML